ncbi:hypothetical protein CNR22_03665 [Sphingobacteriaceae bacterium]|nr:hypothetical protein CNR22_03665 [Sphingobacteriaceae bacterium]
MLYASILSAQQFKLEIVVTGFKNDKGNAFIGLYNTKESFMKEGFKSATTIVKNKITYAVFNDLPKGVYAVSLIHDENSNGKLETNFFGIPKEGFGISNDAKGFMGPPKYEDAKFELTSDKRISIKIQ